jgi:pimeloyl-ACP methyl ester carboxylesterase
VLFIHGIGVGLYQYTDFLRDINETGGDDAGVGVIAIEIMPISSRITYQAFDMDLIVNEIREILKHHGWRKYMLIGHSYGTGICTHLLKSQSTTPLVGPVVLIDPICFLLHLPDVAYNFTVRRPAATEEFVLWYFGSKDIGVAHTLARRFFWHEHILWKEDLEVDARQGLEDRTVTVVLSGKDDIIDAKAVRRYLKASLAAANDETIRKIKETEKEAGSSAAHKETGLTEILSRTTFRLEVIWFERFHHGEVFDFKKARKAVIGAIIDQRSFEPGKVKIS